MQRRLRRVAKQESRRAPGAEIGRTLDVFLEAADESHVLRIVPRVAHKDLSSLAHAKRGLAKDNLRPKASGSAAI